jgi:hypothetical protein
MIKLVGVMALMGTPQALHSVQEEIKVGLCLILTIILKFDIIYSYSDSTILLLPQVFIVLILFHDNVSKANNSCFI